jgi:hypothetical protein
MQAMSRSSTSRSLALNTLLGSIRRDRRTTDDGDTGDKDTKTRRDQASSSSSTKAEIERERALRKAAEKENLLLKKKAEMTSIRKKELTNMMASTLQVRRQSPTCWQLALDIWLGHCRRQLGSPCMNINECITMHPFQFGTDPQLCCY